MNDHIRKYFYIIIILNVNVPIKKAPSNGEIPEMEQTKGDKKPTLVW